MNIDLTEYDIKDERGKELGYVQIHDDYHDLDFLDFVLTPVIVIVPKMPSRISHFLASPRTQIDTRPREETPPHYHVGDPPRQS